MDKHEKRIITISREFGSGGRTIGRRVAEELGIPFYDKEIVEQISLESGFAPQGVPGIMNGLSTADFLWNIQCGVILQLAEKGPCVIVGRNADYILKDREDVMDVYIHADTEFKAERIVRLYGEAEKSPEQRLAEKDKRRRVNYQHYTGRTWGAAQNYEMCLCSSMLGIDQCVKIIVEAVKISQGK